MSVIPTIRRKREGGMGKRDLVSLKNKTDKNQIQQIGLDHSLRFQ